MTALIPEGVLVAQNAFRPAPSTEGTYKLAYRYDEVDRDPAAISEHQKQIDAAKAKVISQYKTFYYSGGQAQIYIDDIFLDEVVGLSFSTITNKTPLYAYSSVYYDTVARGNILISGSLEINFVHSDYLAIIARDLSDRLQKMGINSPFVNIANEFYPLLDPSSEGPKEVNAAFQLQQSLNRMKGLGNVELVELFRQVEESKVGRQVSTFEEFYNIPSFDIWAVFGNIHDPSANSAVRKIVDVHLTGQTQTIYANGEPIKEQYSFIGRDIV
jgi:hypothetical protein